MSPRRLRPSDAPGEIDVLRALATALTATAGRSVLLITHRMTHTEQCDEVVVLSDGAVLQRGAPGQLGGWYADALAREHGETAADA